jgi:hypothetical protein
VRTRRQRAGPALLWISVNCAARYAVPPDRPRQNPAAARQFAELNENRRVDERIRLAVRLPSRDTARRATGLAPLSTRGSRGARTPTCWNARAPPIAPKTDRGHAEPPPNADRRVADVLPVERQRAGVATAQRRQHGSALGAVAVVDAGRVEQGGHDVDELKGGGPPRRGAGPRWWRRRMVRTEWWHSTAISTSFASGHRAQAAPSVTTALRIPLRLRTLSQCGAPALR